MPVGEFELIREYFSRNVTESNNIELGIGDDAALITVPPGQQLVVAIDTLVSGIHFPEQTNPADIAYKALAVNLSDMAAMGAAPVWFTLALTLPEANEGWLRDFSKGLFELAEQYQIPLIGGDTTRGPLTITIQIAGHVPAGQALLRKGACVGDIIYTTGTLGDAAAALSSLQQRDVEVIPELLQRLHRPIPRVEVGIALRGLASACIDISDGLLADLGHILKHSDVGAELEVDRLPASPSLLSTVADTTQRRQFMLNGGDDYELCFTISPDKEAELKKIQNKTGVRLTRIGTIQRQDGLRCIDQDGLNIVPIRQGYQHFH